MNVFIVTVGSRGDVQPYVALGKGLKAAGHDVTVCTSVKFQSFIEEYGLTYGHMSNELIGLMDTQEGRDAIENTGNIFGMIRTNIKLYNEAIRINKKLMFEVWETAQKANPDLIIYHPKALAAPHIAEKLGIPVMFAIPAPMLIPTGEFPVVGVPLLGGNIRVYNRLTYGLVSKGYSVYNGMLNEFRQDVLGLEKMSSAALVTHLPDGEPMPVLHSVSPHVVPRPSDWPDNAFMNGYWFLDRHDDWEPPADLQAFLDAGEPPVYAGFGSMAGQRPEELARIVVGSFQRTGVRGIIATGWGGLKAENLPDDIFMLEEAPHDWLFPRMAAVIHHGGAGTTAAGLRAGRPTIICNFIADQPFWGERVKSIGAGPPPISHKKLTVDKLTKAIRDVTTNESMRENARKIGEKIRAEDGVADTVAVIEQYVKQRRKISTEEPAASLSYRQQES